MECAERWRVWKTQVHKFQFLVFSFSSFSVRFLSPSKEMRKSSVSGMPPHLEDGQKWGSAKSAPGQAGSCTMAVTNPRAIAHPQHVDSRWIYSYGGERTSLYFLHVHAWTSKKDTQSDITSSSVSATSSPQSFSNSSWHSKCHHIIMLRHFVTKRDL